jgi:dihydrodipicolinate synthase/N-acetylneuraminate lyase
MRIQKKYRGVIVPMVTPLTTDHRLDHAAVDKIFENFRKHGAFWFILGTTGESASLSPDLKNEFLKLAGKLRKTNDVLYAGISSSCLEDSIKLAKESLDNGADVLVSNLPSYYPLAEAQMLKYFEQLAGSVHGPLMIYNIPATTNMSIPLNIIEQLSHHENIVGIKDSERNEERLKESVERWKDREDFSHFLGWAAKSSEAILSGSDGLIPSTANFCPGIYTKLYQAAGNGNQDEAFFFQRISDRMGDLYQKGRTLSESIWALKVVMNELGLCGTDVMPPIYQKSAMEEKELRTALQEIILKERLEF